MIDKHIDQAKYFSCLDLLDAIKGNLKQRIKEILLYNPDFINCQDINGDTPLHLAIGEEWLEMIEFFLEFGANPNIANLDGETPVHIAALVGNLRIIEDLAQRGGDFSLTNSHGEDFRGSTIFWGNSDILNDL